MESVRLRSIPVKLDAAMPRRAAVLTGKVDAARATAHAYIVFSTPEEAKAALVHNMQLVSTRSPPAVSWVASHGRFCRALTPQEWLGG